MHLDVYMYRWLDNNDLTSLPDAIFDQLTLLSAL